MIDIGELVGACIFVALGVVALFGYAEYLVATGKLQRRSLDHKTQQQGAGEWVDGDSDGGGE